MGLVLGTQPRYGSRQWDWMGFSGLQYQMLSCVWNGCQTNEFPVFPKLALQITHSVMAYKDPEMVSEMFAVHQ